MTLSLTATLETLFEPWLGEADNDETVARYVNFDPTDKANVVAVVKSDLLGHFATLSIPQRELIAAALDSACSESDSELKSFLGSILPPFSL